MPMPGSSCARPFAYACVSLLMGRASVLSVCVWQLAPQPAAGRPAGAWRGFPCESSLPSRSTSGQVIRGGPTQLGGPHCSIPQENLVLAHAPLKTLCPGRVLRVVTWRAAFARAPLSGSAHGVPCLLVEFPIGGESGRGLGGRAVVAQERTPTRKPALLCRPPSCECRNCLAARHADRSSMSLLFSSWIV